MINLNEIYNNIHDGFFRIIYNRKMNDTELFFDYLRRGEDAFVGNNNRKSYKSAYYDPEYGVRFDKNVLSDLNKEILCDSKIASEVRNVYIPDKLNSDGDSSESKGVVNYAYSREGIASDKVGEFPIPSKIIKSVPVNISNSYQSILIKNINTNKSKKIIEFIGAVVAKYMDAAVLWGLSTKSQVSYGLMDHNSVDTISENTATMGGYIPCSLPVKENRNIDIEQLSDGLRKMMFHMPAGHRSHAKWLMHPNTIQVLKNTTSTDGRYLVDIEQLKEEYLPASLFGKPVIVSDLMPDLKKTDCPSIILADFEKAYILTKMGEVFIQHIDKNTLCLYFKMHGENFQPGAIKFLKNISK